MRHLYVCRIKECGHVWSGDYDHISDPGIKTHRRWYRLGPGGVKIHPGDPCDSKCPKCGRTTGNIHGIKGEYSSKHECNESCWNAKGDDCRCSCGGANHSLSRRLYCDDAPDAITDDELIAIRGLDAREALEAEIAAERAARRAAKQAPEVTLDLFAWSVTTDDEKPAPHPVESLFDARASPDGTDGVEHGLW